MERCVKSFFGYLAPQYSNIRISVILNTLEYVRYLKRRYIFTKRLSQQQKFLFIHQFFVLYCTISFNWGWFAWIEKIFIIVIFEEQQLFLRCGNHYLIVNADCNCYMQLFTDYFLNIQSQRQIRVRVVTATFCIVKISNPDKKKFSKQHHPARQRQSQNQIAEAILFNLTLLNYRDSIIEFNQIVIEYENKF